MCGIAVLLSSADDAPPSEAQQASPAPVGRLQPSDFVSLLRRRGPDQLGNARVTLPPSMVRGPPA
jgi:hypothetical protein